MSSSILRNHALTHMWAEPIQDHQYRIKPSRITGTLGAQRATHLMWEHLILPEASNPTSKKTFHVYPLGQIPSSFFSLDFVPERWYRVDEACKDNSVVIDVIVDNGAIVPRHICYLACNVGKDFVLVIERTDTYYGKEWKMNQYLDSEEVNITLDRTGISIRFYKNAVQQSLDWRENHKPMNTSVQLHHKLVTNSADFRSFLTESDKIIKSYNGEGAAVYYVDGLLMDRPVAFGPTYANKTLTMMYDQTIKEKLFFPINKLTGFKSKLDPYNDKLLVVSPSIPDDKIDFFDDVDLYVIARTTDKSYRGVMANRIQRNTMRQVTHNAWSIRADIIRGLVHQNEFVGNFDNAEILLVIRHGGMSHPLGFQANRIEELYHLTYKQRIEAMALVNSNVPFWKAPELESSAYIEVMSSNANQITNELVEDAYGYNAACKAVMKTNYPVIGGTIILDEGYWQDIKKMNPSVPDDTNFRTIFWYGADGKLLGYSSSDTTLRWVRAPEAYRSKAKYAEAFLGKLVDTPTYVGNIRDTEIVETSNFGYYGQRHYVCGTNGGVLDNNWVDVTDSPFVSLEPAVKGKPPTYKWNYNLLAQAGFYPCTRFADTISVQTFTANPSSTKGYIEIPLMALYGGYLQRIGLPPGHVDVFMDNEPLIQGLDYYWVKGGSVVVTRQRDSQRAVKFIVRFYGYMNPETNKPHVPRDVGWVKNGILSMNKRFNPIHDIDAGIIVAGRKFLTEEVSFDEDGTAKNPKYDGYPYAVSDFQKTVEHFTSKRTVDYQLEAMKIDKEVGDYLTPRTKHGDPVNEYVHGMEWPLYSPIMGVFINKMVLGEFSDQVLNQWLNENTVAKNTQFIVDQHKAYDPIILGYDEQYSHVAPYPFRMLLEVTQTQYKVLEMINTLHLKDKIVFQGYLSIKQGT